MKNSNISCQCQERRRGFAKDSNTIIISFDRTDDFIVMDSIKAMELTKQYFKDEYKYYLKNNTFKPPITGYSPALRIKKYQDSIYSEEQLLK